MLADSIRFGTLSVCACDFTCAVGNPHCVLRSPPLSLETVMIPLTALASAAHLPLKAIRFTVGGLIFLVIRFETRWRQYFVCLSP